jgi:5'-phosphate synthase pdxT subunit
MSLMSSEPTHEVGIAPIGVLALQGGFAAHARVLRSLGARVREVRVPADLEPLAGLVLPGGESTTMTLGIQREKLAQPLSDFVKSGKPVLATCAGAILLDSDHLGLVDFDCVRNAYGSQIRSFEAELEIDGVTGDSAGNASPAFPGVFIRAPRITRTGTSVERLAELDGDAVVVRQGSVIALTFHPELTIDDRIHRRFLESVPITNVTELNRQKRSKVA